MKENTILRLEQFEVIQERLHDVVEKLTIKTSENEMIIAMARISEKDLWFTPFGYFENYHITECPKYPEFEGKVLRVDVHHDAIAHIIG